MHSFVLNCSVAATCVLSTSGCAARAFPNPDMEAAALIYNYDPVYTEALDPGFEQCYFFDAA